MKKYRCLMCGHIYDEEKEGTKFSDLPESWTCPMCGVPKAMFQEMEEDTSDDKKAEAAEASQVTASAQAAAAGQAAEGNTIESYLNEYARNSDSKETNMSDIHEMLGPARASFLPWGPQSLFLPGMRYSSSETSLIRRPSWKAKKYR